MARCLDGPVLHLPRDLRSELPCVLLTKLWVMACVTLNTDLPALLRHSKHKCPAVLGIQISVCEYKEALVISQLDVLLQVVKYVSSMVLFDSCVLSYTRSDSALSRQLLKTEGVFEVSLGWSVSIVVKCFGLDSDSAHAFEEDLECRLHIVYKHLLEVLLLLSQLGVGLVLKHLEDDTFVDVPVTHVTFKIVESLGLFAGILCHPVTFS